MFESFKFKSLKYYASIFFGEGEGGQVVQRDDPTSEAKILLLSYKQTCWVMK